MKTFKNEINDDRTIFDDVYPTIFINHRECKKTSNRFYCKVFYKKFLIAVYLCDLEQFIEIIFELLHNLNLKTM